MAGTVRSPLEGKVWPETGFGADLRKAVRFIRSGQWRKLAGKLRKRMATRRHRPRD